MKKYLLLATIGALISGVIIGDDSKLIAHWDFQNETFPGAIRGTSKLVEENGQTILRVIESPNDKPGGFMMKNIHPQLTPGGAFRLDVKFKMTENNQAHMVLWDNKYIWSPKRDSVDPRSHSGFLLRLSKNGENWVPTGFFGFGKSSLTVTGNAVKLNTGEEYVLSMEYTPAAVTFTLNDKPAGQKNISAPGKLAPAVYRTVIGDRIGSHHAGFCGDIFEVKLFEIPFVPLNIAPGGRQGFIRLEKKPELKVLATNLSGETVTKKITMHIREFPQLQFPEMTVELPIGAKILDIPLDSRLKPGSYHLDVEMGNIKREIPFFVVAEFGDIYPVLMWGLGNNVKLRKAGFSHTLFPLANHNPDPKNIYHTRREMKPIDDALAAGVLTLDNNSFYRTLQDKFPRIARDGKPYKRINLDAANPEVIKLVAECAEKAAKAYGSHPAYVGALIHSEVRDGSNPSFSGFEEKAFKEYAGFDVPEIVTGRWAPNFRNLADFPASQVVGDDYPLLKYFRWWWRTGDGWNALHGTAGKSYHKHVKHHFWTFYDPAVRVPPLWGSGGDVDCISQWSYTAPDPIKVGQTTDEMLAMGGGKDGQMVMSMTQAFWYRNQSAPFDGKINNPPEWLSREKEAKYISISSDHLKIAFWSMISRRLDGIMYHGYSSLIEPAKHAYRFTNPELSATLGELVENVAQPFGPLLKRVPERKPEMAVLQSFTSTMFAIGRASFGWGRNWVAELHMALMWGGYQPAVIYENHIQNGILKDIDVLVLPGVEVLPESVFREIRKFQDNGGIIIGDNHLLPGILPDISITEIKRDTQNPQTTKAALQELGATIRRQLEPHWQSYSFANSPDIVVRTRTNGNADYLFAVNDKRTFGDYVGQWKLVQENGLPEKGEITVKRRAGAVYDLVNHGAVDFRVEAQKTIIPVNLQAAEGKMFLILDKPLQNLKLVHPQSATIGKKIALKITIADAADALIPVAIQIHNPQGETAPGSGYYCLADGILNVDLVISVNEQPGNWSINVRNLANNQTVTGKIAVQ